jgi:hypothetical protein
LQGSSADSWHNATLAQLEGLLSQLQPERPVKKRGKNMAKT